MFFCGFIERLGQRCAYLCLGDGGESPSRHGQCGDISLPHEPPPTPPPPRAINWTSLTTRGQFQTVSLQAGKSSTRQNQVVVKELSGLAQRKVGVVILSRRRCFKND